MKSLFVGIALAGLAAALGTRPAAAQDVAVRLSWGTDRGYVGGAYYEPEGLRVVTHERDAYRRRAPRRLELRHYERCEADGLYLYCWDAPRRWDDRPVVHVYLTNRAEFARYRHDRGWERDLERRHRLAAERFWRRWAAAHRYRHGRGVLVDLRFAW